MSVSTKMVFHDSGVRMGYHISKQKTLKETFNRMLNTPLRSYQVYLGNARSWNVPHIDIQDVIDARRILRSNGKYMCVHASLLYNIAGATNGISDPKYHTSLSRTRESLLKELDIAAGMDSGVVVHTGSRKNREEGLIDTSETLNYVLTTNSDYTRDMARATEMPIYEFARSRKLILENSAGEGNKLGSTLLEISDIIESVNEDYRDQVKVCIDTAHIFGAGEYDFGNADDVVRFYVDFDDIIGLNKLEVFHLNDSRTMMGSKRDLHENLGLGYIYSSSRDDGVDGMSGLYTFLSYAHHHAIPFIGEPPAKTIDGQPGPGGMWDYDVLRKIYEMEKTS